MEGVLALTMKTILLTGMPGCGKEEFLKVAVRSGYDIIRMGDVVREHARSAGLPSDDRNIGSFANRERGERHPAVWAERTVKGLKPGVDTVIDGVRSLDEVDHFKKHVGDELIIVAVHASPQTRFNRLVTRGREDAPSALREFQERDERELGWGIGNVIAKADRMLVNQGTLDDFRHDVEELLR